MTRRKKVYHYLKEPNGNLLPVRVYNSISEAAIETLFGRTTLGYHLNRYGSCSFNPANSDEVHVVSFRSMIVPNSIEPIIPHLDIEEDYELIPMKYNPIKVENNNWLTKLKNWLGFGK